MVFSDIIYGRIEFPEWLEPFIRIPEFLRLRGVRLSNVDSIEFKDLNGPSRWEHCIGVAHLALTYSRINRLALKDTVHLTLAALLHDIATPPFAHTVEYVLEAFNHEDESNRLLMAKQTNDSSPSTAIFASQLPQFNEVCSKVSKQIRIKIDPDEVARYVTGDGEFGFLINGSIDLDNIDNVTRASMFMGIIVDRKTPIELVKWLSEYRTAPTDLEKSQNEWVKNWLGYKNQMYSHFYNSSEQELGRQAFLQHLIRRVHREGLSRTSIIWNTDEQLLNTIEGFSDNSQLNFYKNSLAELVQRYRLLDKTERITEIDIDEDALRILKNPIASSWLEQKLSSDTLEIFVIIKSRRYKEENRLFPSAAGAILAFKLGTQPIKYSQLPKWQQEIVPKGAKGKTLNQQYANAIKSQISNWVNDRPWLEINSERRVSLRTNLDSVGNWSFRLTKNKGFHTYPATFVHAIPASLINALGLKGEFIIDPFGGTANTAVEAIKLGCKVITSDINKVATLVAKCRLTYLKIDQRNIIRSVTELNIRQSALCEIPCVDNINKWHHPKTLYELRQIKQFVNTHNDSKVKDFLTVCFSDILTMSTARKGKDYGYFADNTPLAKGETSPQYQPAIEYFLERVKRNIGFTEQLYASLERQDKNPEIELARAQVFHQDITTLNPNDWGINKNTASGIITSPPYLCMVDYTLGNRLSYYWLFPEELATEFNQEIGSRRSRMKPDTALESYFEKMGSFASKAFVLLKSGGFLATVVGEPTAMAFKDKKVLGQLDQIFNEAGFELLWENQRPINWHRNHAYSSLKEERVAVHVKK